MNLDAQIKTLNQLATAGSDLLDTTLALLIANVDKSVEQKLLKNITWNDAASAAVAPIFRLVYGSKHEFGDRFIRQGYRVVSLHSLSLNNEVLRGGMKVNVELVIYPSEEETAELKRKRRKVEPKIERTAHETSFQLPRSLVEAFLKEIEWESLEKPPTRDNYIPPLSPANALVKALTEAIMDAMPNVPMMHMGHIGHPFLRRQPSELPPFSIYMRPQADGRFLLEIEEGDIEAHKKLLATRYERAQRFQKGFETKAINDWVESLAPAVTQVVRSYQDEVG